LTGLSLAAPDARTPVRFQRQKFFPASDWQAVTAAFLSLFHRYGYIYRPHGGDSWFSADERWCLTDTEILKAAACVHPKYLLGTRAGKSTRFVVLDIDSGSRYHTPEHLDRLLSLLMEAGLAEPVVYQSSHSGGWHVYIFFDEPVPSKEAHQLFCELLQATGWLVRKGTLEVFPHPGDGSLGYGLRLPLQPGFAWLNSHTLDIEAEREWLTPQQAVNRFMSDCRHFGNDYAAYRQLKQTVAEKQAAAVDIADRVDRALGDSKRHVEAGTALAAAAVDRVFRTLPPGIMPDVWCRGRSYFETGLTGPSQRADAIFTLGHYLFYGDPDHGLEPLGYGYEEERRLAIERILALRHYGNSKDIARGRTDAIAQVGRATRWRPAHKKESEVTRYKRTVPIAWVRHNGKLKADAVTRIKTALETFVEASRPFTAKELAAAAGCSRDTLYKHKAIWKHIQEGLYRNRLTECPDEYNAVEGAGSPKPGALLQECPEDMPPGRLAARRIAFELGRRARRDWKQPDKVIHDMSVAYPAAWKSDVERNLPSTAADARELKTALAVLLSLLSRSPDEEHQTWLQAKVQTIRGRLQSLRETFTQQAVTAPDPSG
jgi:TOTE conflict system, Archaeo-Eukaryotic Primase domain